MANKFKFKINWWIVVAVLIAMLLVPILVISILGVSHPVFRLSLADFVSSWIELLTAVTVIIGLYNIKLSIDKKESEERNNKLHLERKMLQFEREMLQFEREGYYKYVEFLMSDNEVVRITAITNLHILAQKNPKDYRDKVCDLFCEMVKSVSYLQESDVNAKMPRYINLILKILFMTGDNVFSECEKNLNNCVFHRIVLNSAVVNKTSFMNAKFINCSFHNTRFIDSQFIKAHMESCVFRTCEIKKSNFHKSIMSNVEFDRGHLLYDLQFSQAQISKCVFLDMSLKKDTFDNCTFKDVKFTKCKFDQDCVLNENVLEHCLLQFETESALSKFMSIIPQNQIEQAEVAFPFVRINPTLTSCLDV